MSRFSLQALMAALLLAASLCPVQALNLTPRPEVQKIDGYPIPYFSFEDGDHRVTYSPPKGWKIIGSANQLNIEDPATRQVTASFKVLPMEKTEVLNEATTNKFKAVALAMVPAEAENVSLADGLGQSILCNREAYAVNLTYGYYGQKHCIRAIFVRFETYNIQFVASGSEQNFEKFVKDLDGSLSSWSWSPVK